MAHGRSSQGRFAQAGPRRKVSWNEGVRTTVLTLTASGGVALGTTGQTPTIPGLTIIRTRGEARIFLSSVSAALDGFQTFGLGIGVASATAFATGAAAVPTPLTEASWAGWLWYWSGPLMANAAISDTDGSANIRIPIDSKAMRKLRDDEVVYFAAEAGTEVGTAVAKIYVGTRQLFKLP